MKKLLAALALALPLLTVNAAAFSDVDEGLYYAAPIAWAVEQGITTGTTETTFSPDALCTRGQIITFLWRAAGSPAPVSSVSPFSDVTETLNPDFYKAILWAHETGVTGEGSRFYPSAPCDRGTTVLFLWRCAGSPASSAPGAFTDVDPNADYARAVAWAVETGITDGTAETTFSPTEPCTRGQIATYLYRSLNDVAPAPEDPEEPEPSPDPQAPEPSHPLRTITGEGKAYSLGLDGSEFTSDDVYHAVATVDIYSPYDAVFTVKVPFPLFQACSYVVRFENPDRPGEGYVFTYLRWDEAFADMIPWEGEHYQYLFSDMTGAQQQQIMTASPGEDDRMGGIATWQISFMQEGQGSFNYDLLEGYQISCEVYANPS